MKRTDKNSAARGDRERAHDFIPAKQSITPLYILPALAMVIILVITACSDMDDTYDQFLEGGEKIYPAKADSAKVHPGRNRLKLSWLILADPKVTRAKIFWNSRQESVEVAIEKTTDVDTISVMLDNLAEGSYVFDIITYDNKEHASMVTEVVGNVYGDEYESTLLIRPVTESYTKKGGATLRFGATNEQALSTEVLYTDNSGTPRKIFVPTDVPSFQIADYLEGSAFQHRTLFKPDTLAIDTFYTAFQEVMPDAGVVVKMPYTKGTWTIAGFSSEEPANNRLASKLIDNQIGTWWIARYSSPQTNYPDHWVTIDMHAVYDVEGFIMVQKNGDRKIKVMELLISNDNATWTSLGDFTLANAEKTELFFTLPQKHSFRYFKMVPKSGHDSQLQPGLAEIGTFWLE